MIGGGAKGPSPAATLSALVRERLGLPPSEVGQCDNKECPRDGSTSGGMADTEKG